MPAKKKIANAPPNLVNRFCIAPPDPRPQEEVRSLPQRIRYGDKRKTSDLVSAILRLADDPLETDISLVAGTELGKEQSRNGVSSTCLVVRRALAPSARD